MGWRGTLRSLNAAANRMERDARRRQRELEGQRKQVEKMEQLERARYEVELYENLIDLLQTVHHGCGDSINWRNILYSQSPDEPKRKEYHEKIAQENLNQYEPSFFDKLLKKTGAKRDELILLVEDGRKKDENEYQKALRTYNLEIKEWQSSQKLSQRVLDHDLEAYYEVLRQANILMIDDISELDLSLDFQIHDQEVIVISVNGVNDEGIPKESKSILKSGKLSVKQMTKTNYFALYQDYVCGLIIRIAREVFALLPVSMVIITANGDLLNTKTGHIEETPILSVAIPRKTLDRLNIEMIDQSDAMENFLHNMKFLKTKGFSGVKQIIPSDIEFEA